MKNPNLVIFSGGTGNNQLCKSMYSKLGNNLSIIINGYDNGKSTGLLRNLCPGMLGPSDFRKNILNLMNKSNYYEKNLFDFLNYRLKKYDHLHKFLNLDFSFDLNLKIKIQEINYEKDSKIFSNLHILKKIFHFKNIDFNDISIGNLIFTKFYLESKNFNQAIKKLKDICNIKANIYSISNQNLYLYGIEYNKKIILDEELISQGKFSQKIDDIFLLKENISKKKIKILKKKKITYIKNFFKKKNIKPDFNQIAKKAILNANIIIYGSGTQYSSLFPSYLTKDFGKTIERSKAIKIYISNILYDKDIKNLSGDEIINYFFRYCSGKDNLTEKQKKKLVNYYFINKIDKDNLNYKSFMAIDYSVKKNHIISNFQDLSGVHYPISIIKKINKISHHKLKISEENNIEPPTISIVIPVLNEEKRISKVITSIYSNPYLKDRYYEIIVVDGGSSDKTIGSLKKFKNIKLYSLANVGRGEAISYGIKKSFSDLVIIFPSDHEYESNDIQKLVNSLISNNVNIVFGSRTLMIKNLKENFSYKIKKNLYENLMSKYGNILISTFLLFKYRRYSSDPLTTFIATKRNFILDVIKKDDVGKGVDFNCGIICSVFKRGVNYIEVPVKYNRRSYEQGKKINIYDGLLCLLKIILR